MQHSTMAAAVFFKCQRITPPNCADLEGLLDHGISRALARFLLLHRPLRGGAGEVYQGLGQLQHHAAGDRVRHPPREGQDHHAGLQVGEREDDVAVLPVAQPHDPRLSGEGEKVYV